MKYLLVFVGFFSLFILTLYITHINTYQSIEIINSRAGLSLKEEDIIESSGDNYYLVVFQVSQERFRDYLQKTDKSCNCILDTRLKNDKPLHFHYIEAYEKGNKIYRCRKDMYSFVYQEPNYILYLYYGGDRWQD